MKKYRGILITFLYFCALALHAQVKGTVKDSLGEPVVAASVFWLGTTIGTTTDDNGNFTIAETPETHRLVASYMGYKNDTIDITAFNRVWEFVLNEAGVSIDEVSVVKNRRSTFKLSSAVLNTDVISSAELTRAACCNLGESFIANPSVDVSYADAATGAKQIRLLGLSGTYVQMLTENIPNYRGAAMPFSLGYIPGPWMQSIQVSKGNSSVKNGYEAMTGQINVEFKKPQAPQAVSGNLFANSKGRIEGNFDGNIHLNSKWSTSLLGHYENSTRTHDSNKDGFIDTPDVEQYNFQNRWAYLGDRTIFQAGMKILTEDRVGGQKHIDPTSERPAYRIDISTERYEAFAKNAYIFNKEKNSNIALMLSGSFHKQDALYGYKLYDVKQTNGYASLMFETDFTKEHNLSVGASYNYDYYNQDYRLESNPEVASTSQKDKERTPGAYVQYTYNYADKLVLMGGLRVDHSNWYGTFVTPRAHVKYTPSELMTLRLSAGKGYRSPHALAENNYLLASGRKIIIDDELRQEEAWNYGVSATFSIPLWNKDLSFSAEYYYTDFKEQMVVDMESTPGYTRFTNLSGDSYSHTFQVEASYPFFKGFTLTGAYRYTDVKTSYNGILMERPLTGKYKGLLTASYRTPLGLWQFDATLQLNGGGRMPTPYITDGNHSWAERYSGFEQLSAQITREFRRFSVYVGGENLTGVKQKNPIISAESPWSDTFDSTMIWGPVHGAVYYIGMRVNM